MTQLIGYARVSTADQDLEGQRRRLIDAGASRLFEDVTSGGRGTATDRPGFAAMLEYAREGDTICVVRLDRLGRSLHQLLETVELLKNRRLGLRSLAEQIDTCSTAGQLTFHIFGALAEFERGLIAERTKDGLAAARAQGRVPGRRPLDPQKSAAALKLIGAGLSPTEAARQVGIGRSTVYREFAASCLGRGESGESGNTNK